MKKIVIACPHIARARSRVEAAGVSPVHPRLHYATRAEGVTGLPIGNPAVDLTDGASDAQSAQLRRILATIRPRPVALADLSAALDRLDEADRPGADAVARQQARHLAQCIERSRENAERYATRADAHERRHEYAEARKLREWSRRSHAEADNQEASGAELLALLKP